MAINYLADWLPVGMKNEKKVHIFDHVLSDPSEAYQNFLDLTARKVPRTSTAWIPGVNFAMPNDLAVLIAKKFRPAAHSHHEQQVEENTPPDNIFLLDAGTEPNIISNNRAQSDQNLNSYIARRSGKN